MKKYRHLLIALFACVSYNMEAQQMPYFINQSLNNYFYNPAFVGHDSVGSMYLGHRQQWVSMPDAPVSTGATIETPILKGRVGVGAMAYLDQTHLFKKTSALMSYAYHLKLSKATIHRVSIGLSIGFLSQSFDLAKAKPELDFDNATYNVNPSALTYDIGFGLNYQYQKFNIGFAIPQITGSQVNYIDQTSANPGSVYNIQRNFMGKASYLFELGYIKYFKIEPSFLFRYFPGMPYTFDFNGIVRYKDDFLFGAGYRFGNDKLMTAGIHGTIGIKVAKSFTIAYSYETPLDPIAMNGLGGTHEFLVGISFGSMKKKITELERKISDLDSRPASDGVSDVTNEQISVVNETIQDIIKNETDMEKQLKKKNADLQKMDQKMSEMLMRIDSLEKQNANIGQRVKMTPNTAPEPETQEEVTKTPTPRKEKGSKKIKNTPEKEKLEADTPSNENSEKPAPKAKKQRKEKNKTAQKTVAENEETPQQIEVKEKPQRVKKLRPVPTDIHSQYASSENINTLVEGKQLDTLPSIHFAGGSEDITEYSTNKLNNTAQQIVSKYKDKKIKIILAGNSSMEGLSEKNYELSLKRTVSIRNFLASMGIESEFILNIGYGSTRPITEKQETLREKTLNRRVDIYIVVENP
jgi:type IX secretion system PorP/SprF family membrane protein